MDASWDDTSSNTARAGPPPHMAIKCGHDAPRANMKYCAQCARQREQRSDASRRRALHLLRDVVGADMELEYVETMTELSPHRHGRAVRGQGTRSGTNGGRRSGRCECENCRRVVSDFRALVHERKAALATLENAVENLLALRKKKWEGLFERSWSQGSQGGAGRLEM